MTLHLIHTIFFFRCETWMFVSVFNAWKCVYGRECNHKERHVKSVCDWKQKRKLKANEQSSKAECLLYTIAFIRAAQILTISSLAVLYWKKANVTFVFIWCRLYTNFLPWRWLPFHRMNERTNKLNNLYNEQQNIWNATTFLWLF